MIDILIADERAIFREGLKNSLASEREFRVIGDAPDGEQALELAVQLRPDILLLDFQIPGISALDVLQTLSEMHSSVRTILLAGIIEANRISRAFELGACGLVLKDSATSLLFSSIREVMAGQYWIGRTSVSSLDEILRNYQEPSKHIQPKDYGLTPRQMQILKAVVSGYQNKEIAGQLSISEQTVKHHIAGIFDKLGVSNRLELALFAFNRGMIED